MKKLLTRITTITFTAVALMLNVSCKEEEPSLTVSPSLSYITFSADGASVTGPDGTPVVPIFTVTTNQKPLNVRPNQEWVKVVDESDNGFTLSVNEVSGVTAPTSAIVTVTAGSAVGVTIMVNQLACAPL